MFEVKQINSNEDAFSKSEISKKGSYVSSCSKNEVAQSFHFGIFKNNYLVGICSFVDNKKSDCLYESVYQLNEMIVFQEQNRNQIEWDLLMHAEAFLKTKNVHLIWCDVIISQVSFFEKSGFITDNLNAGNLESSFSKLMYKLL